MAEPPVPVIDLRHATGASLVEALATESCALIVGHGVAPETRRALADEAKAFFDQDVSLKEPIRWPGDGRWRGWVAMHEGRPETTGGRPPELNEKLEVNLQWRTGDGGDPTQATAAADFDHWPTSPDGLQAVWEAYAREMWGLSSRLITMIVEAIGLTDGLDAWTVDHYANLVAVNYPAQPDEPESGQLRTSAHTDRGGLTLLAADDAPGGLEVDRPDGSGWVPVAIPPDAYLLQAGDLLNLWTGGLIPANRHRVANPPREVAATSRRMSFVYFHYPDLDSVVTPALPQTGEQALPSVPVRSGEHLIRRQSAYAERTDEHYDVTAAD